MYCFRFIEWLAAMVNTTLSSPLIARTVPDYEPQGDSIYAAASLFCILKGTVYRIV